MAEVVLVVARVDPKRAAMGRDLLDVEQAQPVVRKDPLDDEKREIAEVLVIDRVELVLPA